MKVALITPIMEFIDDPPDIPDLGLGYLATYLRKAGHDVIIKAWSSNPTTDDLKALLAKYTPEVIGMKVFTKDVRAAKKTLSIIRLYIPEVVIVIGGPHPSAVEPAELMADFVECDFAMRGEAEFTFPLLLSEISIRDKKYGRGYLSNNAAKEIGGLAWRDQQQVYSNPITLCRDLDQIEGPAWDLINPHNYSMGMINSQEPSETTAPLITTRGCPGKCTYCSVHMINGRDIRSRSPENVFKELLFLYYKYSVKNFMFMDNCFTANSNNLITLCSLIISSDININWDCVTYERLDNLTEEMLSLMHNAGCRTIHMGIESGSELTRKMMLKASSLQELSKKAKLIKNHQIKLGAWFMLGFPNETKQEIIETIRYAFSLRSENTTITIVFPLPGTAVYKYLKSKYNFDHIDWKHFDIFNSIYPMSQLSSKELCLTIKITRLGIRIWNSIRQIIGRLMKVS